MPETSHRVGNCLGGLLVDQHERRRCRLRREQAAAALGHLGGERLAQPAAGLLCRQQQQRLAQVDGGAGLAGKQPLRRRGQQRFVPGEIRCFRSFSHAVPAVY